MKNALDPLANDVSGQITCQYVNRTSKLQIVRIENVANWYFERVVFPGQHLVFQAVSDAVLGIHTSEMATTILADRIPCTQLRYAEVIEPFLSSGEPDSMPLEGSATLSQAGDDVDS